MVLPCHFVRVRFLSDLAVYPCPQQLMTTYEPFWNHFFMRHQKNLSLMKTINITLTLSHSIAFWVIGSYRQCSASISFEAKCARVKFEHSLRLNFWLAILIFIYLSPKISKIFFINQSTLLDFWNLLSQLTFFLSFYKSSVQPKKYPYIALC